ncbi:MAG: DUF4124 domain-containing protein [Deltaproteobacteria bacterium]|nr:DUF4124 domain-containing protein [Deltaproteobacteria bacterium]
MIKIIFAFSALFLSSIAICGEVYTWTDKKGVKRFSNTPVTSQTDTKKVKSIGNETNYTVPVPTNEPFSSIDSTESRPETKKYLEFELPNTSQAKEKAAPEVTPYKIEWSTPRVTGDELSIHGSVSYGKSCKLLTVTAFLYDEKGNEKFIRCKASDVGGSGYRTLDGKIKISSSYCGSDWRISSHSTRCSR